MSVKAVALVSNIAVDNANAGKFKAVVSFAGLESGNTVNGIVELTNVSPTIAATFLEQDIKQAVKDELINVHSYTFGLLDSVRLIGALL
jgi:predicted transcriptional regulator